MAWRLNSASPSFIEMLLTMPLPWMHFRPVSMTLHLELSIMIGTRAISGSPAISLRKRSMAAALSSMASSMLMSMIWAPFSTCCRATASASSKRPSRIMRAKALEPVTLVRSPILTKRWPSPMVTGSRPASRMGGGAGRTSVELIRRSPRSGQKWVSAVAGPGVLAWRAPRAWRRDLARSGPLQRSSGRLAF
jgi:hypothetical protein